MLTAADVSWLTMGREMDDVEFGVRKCELCDEHVPTPILGRHTMDEHSAEDIQARWPGGLHGYFRSLHASLLQSIKAAKKADRMDVVLPLRRSLYAVEAQLERFTAEAQARHRLN